MSKNMAFLALFLFSAISCAFADERRLQCKTENSALDKDIDIFVNQDQSGLFFNVTHHVPSGGTFDREAQYDQREVFFNEAKNFVWRGRNMKRPFLFMVGEIDVRGASIKYTETLRDSHKDNAVVNVLVSTCTLINPVTVEQNQSSLVPSLEAPPPDGASRYAQETAPVLSLPKTGDVPAPAPATPVSPTVSTTDANDCKSKIVASDRLACLGGTIQVPDVPIAQEQPEPTPHQSTEKPTQLIQTHPSGHSHESFLASVLASVLGVSIIDPTLFGSYIGKLIVEVSGALIIIYLLPTAIAFLRGHLSTTAIFALNLILGWTFIGWIIAFIWSLTGNTRRNRDFRQR